MTAGAAVSDLPVVILCGGKGTRLREETEYRPKPMVQIAERPILWHIMKYYSFFGCREFILCLGYKGHVIKEYFNNYEIFQNDFTIHLGSKSKKVVHRNNNSDENEWKVVLSDTGPDTMTGGRLLRVKKYVQGRRFFMTYGDGLSDLDLGELLQLHLRSGKVATLTGVQPDSRYGMLDIKGEMVGRFREKPQGAGYINGGFFVLEPEIFDYISGDGCIFEHEPLQRLTEENQLAVHVHKGFWQCMDTYRDYQLLNNLSVQKPPWQLWGLKSDDKKSNSQI